MFEQFEKSKWGKKTVIRYKGKNYRDVADLPEEGKKQFERLLSFKGKHVRQMKLDGELDQKGMPTKNDEGYGEALRSKGKQTKYVINGKTYHKFSDIPLKERKYIEDGDGLSDGMFEGMPGFVKKLFKVVFGLFKKISGIEKFEQTHQQQGFGHTRTVSVRTTEHKMTVGDWIRLVIMIGVVSGVGVLIYLINTGVVVLDKP